MSTGHTRRLSQSSKASGKALQPAPPPTLTPENVEGALQPCAATANFLLVGQGRQVLCLRRDTLAIERRFDRHREDVAFIAPDTAGDRAPGRTVLSYDVGNTAIVWDLETGDEMARFVAYERLRVGVWMRNGNIAFGNEIGNVVLFDPTTSEHYSTRTIFDPVTSIAPAVDCRSFAIGQVPRSIHFLPPALTAHSFMNGTIIVCTLSPNFTIQHTLTTQRRPSPVVTMQWHGASSKSKSDMLATQTADGDLRVWSVPRLGETNSTCTTIRVFGQADGIVNGPNWFAWSKSGRIIQHSDRRTRLNDVRTKHVTVSPINTADGLVGICNHGLTSTLYTLHKNWHIQQWDLNPDGEPRLIREVQHIPATTPPSPPGSIGAFSGTSLPKVMQAPSESDTSENERAAMSPLPQRKAREVDELEEERRDRLAPLSPGSTRSGSTTSTKSSGRRLPNYLYDRAPSRASTASHESGTEFSLGLSLPRPRESQSIRSSTSYRSSLLRKEVMRSPDDKAPGAILDLFPVTRARLQDIHFKAPDYGEGTRTPDVLRKEMLNVVFGWKDDIRPLIVDEMRRHPAGSSRSVLLAKWLGELRADSMVSMMGSDGLTSSDWMLLALGSIDKASQKKVGEAFVQRLLEKGDVHPAVAILLGLGEHDDAIEAYVSQKCYMEALLLTCLTMPSNWDRQCNLLRRWGEAAVTTKSPELAVRIFSCTSEETTGPWFSPRAQDAVYNAQKEQVLGTASMSPPGSPPSVGTPSRFSAQNASLKLITSFGDRAASDLRKLDDATPINSVVGGVTPIAQSALSPGGQRTWMRENRNEREPASARSARTATPGAYSRRRRPSREHRIRTPRETPQIASREFLTPTRASNESDNPLSVQRQGHRRVSSASDNKLPETLSPARYTPPERKFSDPNHLPSPAHGVFSRLQEESQIRNGSRDRMPDGLQLHMVPTAYLAGTTSPGPSTHATSRSGLSMSSNLTGRSGAASPPLTAASANSLRGRAVDPFISSVDEARAQARVTRERSKPRAESKVNRKKERSASRGRRDVKYIRPAKRSPSSPVPMSPEEVIAASRANAANREAAARADSPVELDVANRRTQMRRPAREPGRARSPEGLAVGRGRSEQRRDGSMARSPSSLLPNPPEMTDKKDEETQSDGQRVRLRSTSRKPTARTESPPRMAEVKPQPREDSGLGQPHILETPPGKLSRKELAAIELAERRASLLRRPSAPVIPVPEELPKRPILAPRHHTELGDSPTSYLPPFAHSPFRSQSVDLEPMSRSPPRDNGPSIATIPIGLPATPKAMMFTKYMAESRGTIPEVPSLPKAVCPFDDGDDVCPLLPSTTFGQPGSGPRAASAPPDHNDVHPALRRDPLKKPALPPDRLRRDSRRGHMRSQTHEGPILSSPHQRSPEIITASIDETLADHIVIVKTSDPDPPLLPELQHLAGPPPPPPIPAPPTDFRNEHLTHDPNQPRASTASPTQPHRRGRGSISDTKSFSYKIRNVTERMRSTSRSRNKSPPISGPMPTTSSPYETVLPTIPPHQPNGGDPRNPPPLATTFSAAKPNLVRRDSLSAVRSATSAYPATITSSTSAIEPRDPSAHPPWLPRPGTAPGHQAQQQQQQHPNALARPGLGSGEHGVGGGGGARSFSVGSGIQSMNQVMHGASSSNSNSNSNSSSNSNNTTSHNANNNVTTAAAIAGDRARSGSLGGSSAAASHHHPWQQQQQQQHGYVRLPKEIRANMPPETLQGAVYAPQHASSAAAAAAAATGGGGGTRVEGGMI